MPLLPKPDADARLVKLRATLLAAVMVLADTDGDGEQRLSQLRKLVRLIRPTRREAELPGLRLAQLALVLRTETTARRALRNALLALLAEKHSVHLFSDAGVLSSEGFSSSLSRRIWHRVLPDVVNTDYLKDVLGLLFDRRDDHEWMEAAGAEAWLDLVRAIDIDHGASHDKGKLALQIVSAIEVLSYRITSIGLEPELVRNYPAIERHESPFLTQNAEVRHFVDEWRKAATDKRDPQLDSRQIDVLLEQCTEIIGKIRKQARRTGASVSLTYQLVRLEQSIARFSQLMKLLEAPPAERNALSVSLFFELVIAENRRYSIGDLFSQNIELLAQRVTGSAGRMGEKYIANSRAEFWALLRAALGAGFFIALMAGTKLLFGFGEHPHRHRLRQQHDLRPGLRGDLSGRLHCCHQAAGDDCGHDCRQHSQHRGAPRPARRLGQSGGGDAAQPVHRHHRQPGAGLCHCRAGGLSDLDLRRRPLSTGRQGPSPARRP